ncbi:hypothetical protein SAICODRAFT_10227 [Saitoella complicata NRRL Y-17804]|uniref:uncharacterized protein n=1 Tax=Saitoella complicata (strain BCRC 22490 / CBS 7301 / JCM 7358 / NBRC 10748 / NRRL Y-17804) TaxID=698492 RepID=UPI000866B3FB|nr:uncharacterized protein SAICODRAFT_10227 [Saitoella complicata NRRL Y-17804]ODQ50175.1 hypothetical protein SAICODRAFT_10227 [Saitoella complicata NRRL Y-17804]
MPNLDVSEFNIVCSVLGAFIVVFGLCSYVVKERAFVSEALVALLIGVAFGPIGSGWIEPERFGDGNADVKKITLAFTRLVIGVQLVLAGVELPSKYIWRERWSLFVLLIPIMTTMWVISALFVYLLIPNLHYIEALVIAACVTPTDPILANSIVRGRFAEKYVAPHLRNIISAESGANDGFGYPFLFLATYLIKYDSGKAIGMWFYETWCYNILLSCAYGTVIGWLAKEVLHFSEKNVWLKLIKSSAGGSRKYIDKESFLVFAIALALFTFGTAGLFGTDDLLACFVAGNVFTWDDWFRIETEKEHLQSTIDMLLNISIFVYLGAIMPWSDFNNHEIGTSVWRLIVMGICVLIARRLPIVLALYKFMPTTIKNFREAMFAGFFGPIGVGAVFYAAIAYEQFEESKDERQHRLAELVIPVVYFLALSSIVVHGVTIPIIKLGQRIPISSLDFRSISISRPSTSAPKNDSAFARMKIFKPADVDARLQEMKDLEARGVPPPMFDPKDGPEEVARSVGSQSTNDESSVDAFAGRGRRITIQDPRDMAALEDQNRKESEVAFQEGNDIIVEDRDGFHQRVYHM